MGLVVTNMTEKPIPLAEGVDLMPGEHLLYRTIPDNDPLWDLDQKGDVRILSDVLTFDERKADAKALNPKQR